MEKNETQEQGLTEREHTINQGRNLIDYNSIQSSSNARIESLEKQMQELAQVIQEQGKTLKRLTGEDSNQGDMRIKTPTTPPSNPTPAEAMGLMPQAG